MDLAKRFEEATAYATINIISLEINIMCPIVSARRTNTKYRPTLVLSIWEY